MVSSTCEDNTWVETVRSESAAPPLRGRTSLADWLPNSADALRRALFPSSSGMLSDGSLSFFTMFSSAASNLVSVLCVSVLSMAFDRPSTPFRKLELRTLPFSERREKATGVAFGSEHASANVSALKAFITSSPKVEALSPKFSTSPPASTVRLQARNCASTFKAQLSNASSTHSTARNSSELISAAAALALIKPVDPALATFASCAASHAPATAAATDDPSWLLPDGEALRTVARRVCSACSKPGLSATGSGSTWSDTATASPTFFGRDLSTAASDSHAASTSASTAASNEAGSASPSPWTTSTTFPFLPPCFASSCRSTGRFAAAAPPPSSENSDAHKCSSTTSATSPWSASRGDFSLEAEPEAASEPSTSTSGSEGHMDATHLGLAAVAANPGKGGFSSN
mmetsp:Transcript_35823/g.73019  ORF Transcript_35823/g.73019 Transcript_35823/m.73019 type:complete len:403 (+) Transcript_35823:545-1753(+)